MRKGQPLNQLTEEKRYFLYFWILRLPFCHQSTLMLMSLKGMSNLVKDGLNETSKVGKGIVFYKIMPERLTKQTWRSTRSTSMPIRLSSGRLQWMRKKREDTRKYLQNNPSKAFDSVSRRSITRASSNIIRSSYREKSAFDLLLST